MRHWITSFLNVEHGSQSKSPRRRVKGLCLKRVRREGFFAAAALALAAVWAPLCATAQASGGGEAQRGDLDAVGQCVAAASDDPSACIGRVMRPCQDEPGAETIAGSVSCAERERTVWRARMDQTLTQLEPALQPGRLDLLRAAQASWIAYRDAGCRYEASAFEGATLGRVIAADCLLHETALRALALEAALREAAPSR